MEPWTPLFRGVLVTALVLLVGVPPTLSFVVFPELERRGFDTAPAHRVALPTIFATLIGAGLAAAGLAVGNARASEAGSVLAWASSTVAGQAWVALTLAAVAAGGLTAGRYIDSDRISRRSWLTGVCLGAFVMLIAFCWTRYSVAVERPALAILVKVGHMTGGALWVGGLAVLAVFPALVPRGDDGIERAELVLATVRRFSMLAVAGVTVAFATGVVIAAWHVPTLTALATTPYGLVLSAKVVLVVVAAAIGGFNRVVLHEGIAHSIDGSTEVAALPGMLTGIRPQVDPHDAAPAVARSVRVELLILFAAMGLSVVLTTAMTPSYELLEPAVQASTEVVVGGVTLAGFGTLLDLGAVAIALAGALALGYEVGKFAVDRKAHERRSHRSPEETRAERK
ncbi:copper resistance D family protein [Halalkalicoccus jeotgali]|uniref:Copper resistance protein n=1 Tax=Halalkalicoccus jeotgali (strain DSM 18796 / CECT 7217 / JCM 14584 / KCTC 4019 / B3) TaxID=795797 RepID=D8J2X6_HALJB|nr:CopD family protein [Halalkalicoccus jeotgali]ADJ15083.1 hypothetical protein HacjB3_08500 [Halalkalicoccus jeotgali B3]ELY34898.1 copper resistance protein [Halalkalicoccus jeotgali B3]